MNIKLKLIMSAMIAFCLFASTDVCAQGAPAAGADMWTGGMALGNLFTPHVNFCDPATEAFVDVIFGLGYCIEKNERPAMQWTDARKTCLQNFKRLPEVAEMHLACDDAAALGLANMLVNAEWSSNFFIETADSSTTAGVHVTGFGGCDVIRTGQINRSGGGPEVLVFRCVR